MRRGNGQTVEPAVLTRAGHSIDFCEWPVIPGIEARSGVNEGSAREALEAGGAQLDTAILMHLASEHQTECERRCEQERGERFPHWCQYKREKENSRDNILSVQEWQQDSKEGLGRNLGR